MVKVKHFGVQAEEAAALAALKPATQPVAEPTGAAKMLETMKDLSHTFKDTVDNLAHNIPEPVSKVLHPITAALHPHSVAPAPAPAGADNEVHVDDIDQVSASHTTECSKHALSMLRLAVCGCQC